MGRGEAASSCSLLYCFATLSQYYVFCWFLWDTFSESDPEEIDEWNIALVLSQEGKNGYVQCSVLSALRNRCLECS